MSRWQPDAPGRLQRAALELYAQRGFEKTTVAEIANRAGLTERTYFRHFADKREVLFRGSKDLRDHLVQSTVAAPPGTPAFAAVAGALEGLSSFFDDQREWSAHRHAVIASSPDLQERELLKRASLVAALTDALRERGENDATATLAAEVGIAAFHIAYERWVLDPEARSYATHTRMTVAELRATCRDEV